MITFDQVTFRYDSQAEPNLIDIDFHIPKGETVLIVGPSGSGKSTIARAINGQIPYTYPGELTGTITLNGRDSKDLSLFDRSLEVGTVLQDTDGQFVGLTVAEDIAFALENDCRPQEEMRQSVQKWARLLGVEDLTEMSPHKLSGGQKQRVSISGILIDEVPILLLDEPLANLDPAAGAETMKLIRQLSQDQGYTTIIVEHRLEEALLADVDRILVVGEGRLLFNDSPTELLKSSVLQEVGVREPLYLTALKYAGVDIEQFQRLGNFQEITLDDTVLQQVEEWASQPRLEAPERSQEIILEAKDVTYSYDLEEPRPTLSQVNFQIHKGEMISVVGSNGAGKSTLAKLLCGFIRPQEGEILLQGQNIQELSIKEIADHIGFVMQNPNNMISKTLIFEEVALGLVNRGVPEDEIEERVNDALKICGLYALRNWPISALSYGQKRRVTIASILVLEPEIMILDEPTAGQDYAHYTEMMDFLEKLRKDRQMTILMITHDMHLMQEYTERSLIFDQGQLLSDTKPSELFSDQSLIRAAHLAETSLYDLGEALEGISTRDFIDYFIAYEGQVRP